MSRHTFFASASRGTESVLADELRELGVGTVEATRGGVRFGGTLADAYRACLWSRVASRVLMPIASFEAADAESLYDGVHAVPWPEHLDTERTIAVAVAGGDSPAGPPNFVTLKVKDAVVDRLREATGRRPDVDKRRPDVRIHVHLRGPQTTVSIDLAGRGLHHRGLGRRDAAASAAPLRENLAAALLRIAGWPAHAAAERPLVDPMCGAGTLLLEGAGMARDVAPGLARGGEPGAAGWLGHDAALWRGLLDEARERRAASRGRALRIVGRDASAEALRAAREMAARAGFGESIELVRGDLRDAAPPAGDAGLLVVNPPYGERLGEAGELGPLYETLGNVLRRRFTGWQTWVLSGNRALDKRIGLRPTARHVVFNGPIECRFLHLPIRDAAPEGPGGPGWRRPSSAARGFERKLRDHVERRERWARREGLTAYRLYDADVPEYNVAIDRYGDAVRVEEHPRPRGLDTTLADGRLDDVMRIVPEALGVDPGDVVLRVRRKPAPGEQHGRYTSEGRTCVVVESDLRFEVNLTDYLDTGLFLDDRLLRARLRERAAGRDVLNLFAYTCAASVAAAAGGARSTTSVDLSRRYLERGRRNFELNGLEASEAADATHRLLRADVLRFLERARRRYGLIFLAPPIRSRSKAMRGELDLARDHAGLIRAAAARLTDDGELVFSTAIRRLELEPSLGESFAIEEITGSVTPPDFAPRPRLRAWSIRKGDVY